MKQFFEQISFCPRCGKQYAPEDFDPGDVLFTCARCQHPFYQNSIPSCSAVIPAMDRPTEVLLLTRRTKPHIGKIALPGGFLRYDEEPAQAVVREVKEETLLEVRVEMLLREILIDYQYRGTRLSVLELSFLTKPVAVDVRGLRTSEAAGVAYYDVPTLLADPSGLAFPEQWHVLARYREQVESRLPAAVAVPSP